MLQECVNKDSQIVVGGQRYTDEYRTAQSLHNQLVRAEGARDEALNDRMEEGFEAAEFRSECNQQIIQLQSLHSQVQMQIDSNQASFVKHVETIEARMKQQ